MSLQAVTDSLARACRGGRALRSTVDLAMNTAADRQRALGLLGVNVETVQALLGRNLRDFALVLKPEQTPRRRRKAWRRVLLRRRNAVRLVEEVPPHADCLRSALEELGRVSQRMDDLEDRLRECPATSRRRREDLREELGRLVRATLESPSSLRRRLARAARWREQWEDVRGTICRATTCGWWSTWPRPIGAAGWGSWT